MTITYDAAGLCTRCGSTGYYLGSYTSDSSFEDTRTCVKSCPCHGWRPIETAPDDGRLCQGFSRYGQGDFRRIGSSWFDSDGNGGPCVWTHWQPLPQPPEEA